MWSSAGSPRGSSFRALPTESEASETAGHSLSHGLSVLKQKPTLRRLRYRDNALFAPLAPCHLARVTTMSAARPPLAFKRAFLRLASISLGDDAQTTTTPYTPPELSTLHSRLVPSPRTCKASYTHDTPTLVLSSLIIAGLVLSYVPQWYRIIKHKNSEGFSPMFLLLGATSSASSLANIVTLQWSQVACCRYLVSHRAYIFPTILPQGPLTVGTKRCRRSCAVGRAVL